MSETAYRELEQQLTVGEDLLRRLDPIAGPTLEHFGWGTYVETLVAVIDRHGKIYDDATPVGMFYNGWNLATFHWSDIGEAEQKRRNAAGFAQAVGALRAIVKVRPAPRLPDKPAAEHSGTAGATARSRDVFVIHGRNEATRETVARFIERLGLNAVILHEQDNRGRTVIEKFEQNADVAFAVAVLTADDVGGIRAPRPKLQPRARQNVIFELGYFFAALGRARVCALMDSDVESPSDVNGLVYIPLDSAGAWKFRLAAELRAAGLEFDLNKAV
jgi:predicted nucleotide-binding protein